MEGSGVSQQGTDIKLHCSFYNIYFVLRKVHKNMYVHTQFTFLKYNASISCKILRST